MEKYVVGIDTIYDGLVEGTITTNITKIILEQIFYLGLIFFKQ